MKRNIILITIISILVFILFRFAVGSENLTFSVLYAISVLISSLIYYTVAKLKKPIFSEEFDKMLYLSGIVMIIELWILFTGGSESPFTVFMIFPLAWIVYFSGFKPVEEFISVGFTIGIHMLSYSDEVKNIFITKLVTLIVIYLVMRLFFKSDNSNKQLPEVSENEEGFENKNLYSTTNKEYRKIKDFFENDKVLLSHKFYGDGDDVQKVERLRVVVKNYFLELYNSFKENHQDVENMMILIDDMKGNIFLFRREEGKINFQSFQLKFNFDQYDKKELSRELKRIIDFDEERLNYHSLQFEDETFGLVITEFQITPDELELIEKFSSDYYTSYILGKLRNMKQSIDYFEKERETYNFITELNAFESVDNIVKKIIGFIKYISKSDDAFFAVFKDSELNIISETGVKEDERKELLGIMKKYFIENQGNEKLKSYSLENEKSKVVVLPIKAFNKNDQDAAIGIFFRNGNLEFSYMNNIEKIMYHSSLLIDKYNLYKEYEQKVFTVKFLGLLFDLVKSKKIDKNIINMVLENILMFFPVSSCKLFMKNDTCFGELRFDCDHKIRDIFSNHTQLMDEDEFSNIFKDKFYPGSRLIPIVINNNLEAVFVYDLETEGAKINLHTLKLILAMLVQIVRVEFLIDQLKSMKRLNEEFLKELNAGVLVLNTSGIVMSVNDRCIEILTTKENTMEIGMNSILPVFDDAIPDGEFITFLRELIQGKIKNTELDRSFKYNSLDIEISLKRIEFEYNEYFLLLIRDNTSKLKQEKYLNTVERLASLGELSAGIAHEIRNPLGGIELYISLLKNKCSDEPQAKKIIDETLSGINDIKNIITNLLNYAKPQKGDYQKLKPADAIDEVLKILKLKLEKSKVTVVKDYDMHSIDKKYSLYFISIKQILLNIILNSIDAMSKIEDINPELCIVSEIIDEKWHLSFKDNGTGMDEATVKKIFDPFYTTKAEGTGLGLSIVHRMIKEISGSIDIKTVSGIGTTVKLTFPLSEDHQVLLEENK